MFETLTKATYFFVWNPTHVRLRLVGGRCGARLSAVHVEPLGRHPHTVLFVRAKHLPQSSGLAFDVWAEVPSVRVCGRACAWRSTNHQRRQRRSGLRAIPASYPSAAPPPADPRPARPATLRVRASIVRNGGQAKGGVTHGTLCAQKGWSPKKGNMTVGMPARRLAAVVPAPPWWIAFITTHVSGLVMCRVSCVVCRVSCVLCVSCVWCVCD
jgi:hypothetical protein